MSKVLVDRELLVRLENAYMEGMSIYGECEEIRAVLAQPAEAEGVEVVGWLHGYAKAVSSDPVVVSGWLPECVEPLMTVAQHQRILSAVTAERDRLKEEMDILWKKLDKFDSQSHGITALAEIERLRAEAEALREDKARLDAIEQECWDVRFLSSPNADAGDSSISIEIVGHFMAEPCERVVGENYNENLRAALDQAMTAEAYPPARPEYDERGRPVRASMAAKEE